MAAQFTIPLITVIPGQLIASSLWNNEWQNLNTNFIPAGMDSYSDTDAQMQIQTNPYPGSVTSHATSLGGEIERIRYQISLLIGQTYWYQPPSANIASLANNILPIGGVIDYPSATAPNANFLLANGQAVGRVAYAALFALYNGLPTPLPFGVGDGSTTFNLPNYTDVFSVGAGGTIAPNVAANGGSTTHILTTAEAPSGLLTLTDPGHAHSITDPTHNHGLTDPGHTHSIPTFENAGSGARPVDGVSTNGTGANTSSATTGASVNSASTGIAGANSNTTGISLTDNGGNTAHSILNPFIGMYKMVRVL